MRRLELRGVALDSRKVNELLPRALNDIDSSTATVLPIIERVKSDGEKALVELAAQFDGVDPRPIRVPQTELDAALANLKPELRSAIEVAIERVTKVSRANLPTDTATTLGDGAVVEQRWLPVDSVGLYVPGGKAVYPSSVVMNVVPALVSGVGRMAMVTPPQKAFGGRPHPTVLATAALLGVTEVYAMGGPAAIAALAFGVPTLELEPVALITGPGNNFVTAAKRAVRGVVGIDSEAGATEIMIIADESANPAFVAADLISQAEHDEAAAAVLVTNSVELIEQVEFELAKQVPLALHSNRIAEAFNGQQSALVLVDSIEDAIFVANAYATEHLELQVSDVEGVIAKIRNAGAVFAGEYSPVSLGDYMAGSNHVLPTSQQAKFGSGLGVHSFLRAQQVVRYEQSALAEIASQIDRLATEEGLPAHGAAVVIREQNHRHAE
jgi:histidinol dehydrogenase